MEETCSSEMSVDFQQATQYYIPQDIGLHDHCFENLRSCMGSDALEEYVASVLRVEKSLYCHKAAGSKFLRNVGTYQPNCILSLPRRQ
jgi:hypothetical protein